MQAAKQRVAKAMASLVDGLAEMLVERVSRAMKNGHAKNGARHKLDMKCRVAGCTHRSRGPRFGYICDAHQAKLGKREQQRARDAYNAKGA